MGLRTRWKGRGLTLLNGQTDVRLYPRQLAPRGLLEFKPPATPSFLPLKNPKGKADEPRPTDTHAGRPPPRCSLTQHIARRPSGRRRGRGGIRRWAGCVPWAVPEAPGAVAARRGAGWRQGGRVRSGAQSSCKGSGAAFPLARGSLKWQHLEDGVSFGPAPGSGPLLPPSPPPPRPPRAPRGFAPLPRPPGPAGGSRKALGAGARPLRAARESWAPETAAVTSAGSRYEAGAGHHRLRPHSPERGLLPSRKLDPESSRKTGARNSLLSC